MGSVRQARRIIVAGRVQGVGYRPFLYRLAASLNLAGWARNGSGEVLIHIEGRSTDVARFETALSTDAPPLARPRISTSAPAAWKGVKGFRILPSVADAAAQIHLPPDLFTCEDCIKELETPTDRRYRYAFINCTQCGPRYTIIEALPYDRQRTSMCGFPLCSACRREYEEPHDRRFHAEPIACPECGPSLAFHAEGQPCGEGEDALIGATALLRKGGILAVKGIGGYHLLCSAADEAAVARLRLRKRRPEKPLAVMLPMQGEDGLRAVAEAVLLSAAEAEALTDPARPIVLAERRADCRLAKGLAPGLAELGVFLPYSPLHHLLLRDFGSALVATSGNISGEPVITENAEAEARLGAVADGFLHHNRPILRPADDSVVRVIAGKARMIRLGRGVAPLEWELPWHFPQPILAVGGHMKVTIALGWENRLVVSPHIGDLDSPRSLDVFERLAGDLQRLYGVEVQAIACDLHPDYAGTRWALRQVKPVFRIQHHQAHAAALAGEYPEIRSWLVFAWDGIGYGGDGTLWGGEALLGAPGRWRRAASFRLFHLPGGDRAAREPWRAAAALMWESGKSWMPAVPSADFIAEAWRKRVNVVPTSSVGRLFDAAAAFILGLEQASFEGQGPMMLESLAAGTSRSRELPLSRDAAGLLRVDWSPLLEDLADQSRPPAERAAMFHESLAHALVQQVLELRRQTRFDAVGLAGGVFQNRRLSERVIERLGEMGIPVFLATAVPANDGGLAFGQAIEALHILLSQSG